MILNKLKLHSEDGIGYITMDYPKNLNAIDEDMLDELLFAFDLYEKDNDIKVVVLRGTDRVFSAGGDIRTFYKSFHSSESFHLERVIEKAGKVALTMKKMSKLIIASVSGTAAGAGASLVLASDLAIAAENAQLIWAFVNLGLVPDTGGCYLLTKSVGVSKAMELAITGTPVNAEKAKALGIYQKICPQELLEQETKHLALHIANGPLKSYTNIKKQIFDAEYSDFENYLKETEAVTVGNCLYSDDFREGIDAFVEKRKPAFIGK